MFLNEQNPVDIFMADSSDSTGETGKAGLVPSDITVLFSKANGNYVAGTGVVTAKTGGGNGEFRYTPAAGEDNVQGAWGIRASAAGCFTWRDTHEITLRQYVAIGMAAANMDTQLAEIEGHASAVDTLTAGKLDVATGTRLAASAYTAPPTAVQNADAWIARNQKGGSNGPSGQTLGDSAAAGFLDFTIVNGVLTVKNGDGTTAFTRTLTRAQLDAIVSSV